MNLLWVYYVGIQEKNRQIIVKPSDAGCAGAGSSREASNS